jgi:hypothetical protein
MSADGISALIGAGTFVCSVVASAFISGSRWGKLEQKMTDIEKSVAEIKGMFVLKLRD